MTELNKNILFQYFFGTASPLQKKLILEWLEDDGNQELFYQWLEEWERDHVQFIPEVSIASEKVMDRLDKFPAESDNPVYPVFEQKRSFSSWKAKWVAAAVISVLGLSFYFFHDNLTHIQYQTAYGEIKEFTLADGSHVVLNANSTLLVPRWGFDDKDRKVELTGEAAFYVKHTRSNQKFLVNTNGQLNVEVLGTEFSVYSRENNNKVELKKGSVKLVFKQAETEPLIMKPGDVVNMSNSGNILVKHQQPTNNFIAWKDHRFVFDSTSLGDVVRSIHEFFGDKIIIGDEILKKKRISGSFKAESSKELLSALALLFNMEILPNGDSLRLEEGK